MRAIIHTHFLAISGGHTQTPLTFPPEQPGPGDLAAPCLVGGPVVPTHETMGRGPSDPGQGQHMARASGLALTAAESSRGSRSHAEPCRQRGGGRQGCPETPLSGEMPTDPSPRSPPREGTPLYAAGDGQARARGTSTLTSTLPVSVLRGADSTPGAQTRGPHLGQPRYLLPSASCQTFQTRLRAEPPGRRPSTPCRARPGGREAGARAGDSEHAWAAPGPGRRSPGWLQSLGKMVPSPPPGTVNQRPPLPGRPQGPRLPARPDTPPRGHLRLARAPGQTLRAAGQRWAPAAAGARPLPAPIARPPAHLPRRRAAAAAAARPPASSGPWLRFPGPRAATPRGSGGPGGSARPGLGGPGGAARRGAHTAAATAQPAE